MTDGTGSVTVGAGRTSAFDADTASRPTGLDTYAGEFSPRFLIGGGVNGGLQLAAAARACVHRLADVGHTQPLTMAATYLTPAGPGPYVVTTDVVRHGRNSSVLRATLSQPGEDGAVDRLTALATFSAPGRADGPRPDRTDRSLPTSSPPEIPPVEDCVGRPSSTSPGDGMTGSVNLLDHIDVRLDPRCAGFAVGRPSMRGLIQGWFRFADGHEPDPLALLFVVDGLPPVTADLGMPGWAPTVELTAHVRGVPSPGWLLVRHETSHVAGGLFEEDAGVWDARGQLVAQSRQLVRVPRGGPRDAR